MFLTSVVLLCWAIGECPHSFPFAKYCWNAGLAWKNNWSFYDFVLMFSNQLFIALNDNIYLFHSTCWILHLAHILC